MAETYSIWSLEEPPGAVFERIFLQRTDSNQAERQTIHRHAGLQICVVRKGSGNAVWATAGQVVLARYALGPGDVMIFPGGQHHGWEDIGPQGLSVLALNIAPKQKQITPALLAALSGTRGPSRGDGKLALAMLLQKIEEEGEQNHPGREELLSLLGQQLVIELARRSLQVPASEERSTGQPLTQARAYMMEHLGSAMGVEEIAKAAGLSASQLGRIFASQLGESPAAVLRRMRVDQARHLLVSTKWPISRIAEECGLSSPQNFSRVFRMVAGCSPQDYRLRAQTEPFG
jgi:AraC-like DNA-binding protein